MPHPPAADRVSAAASAKNVFRMAFRILSALELRRRRGEEIARAPPLGPLPACALLGVAKQGEIDFELGRTARGNLVRKPQAVSRSIPLF